MSYDDEYDEYGNPIEYDEYGNQIVYEYVDERGNPVNPDGTPKQPTAAPRPASAGRSSASDEYRYDRVPKHSRRGAPIGLTIIAIIAVLGIIAGSFLLWVSRQINPSGEQGEAVAELVVPSGASFSDVAKLLEDEEIISSARVMGWYSKVADVDPVKAGTYIGFSKNSSMSDAVDVLNAGPVPPNEKVVQIIPGMWLTDGLQRINDVFPEISVDELSLVLASGQVTSKYHPDPTANWEGYLLPESYRFADDATAQEILQRIVNEFDKTLDNAGYQNAVARTGRSAAELVIIASMIEREKGDVDGEAEKMARVIFNRLDDDMTLGIDATILYGVQRKGNEGGLTKAELETDGPYNSRTRKGLPPTAISLPSKTSLEAAINPAEGDILYYVLSGVSPREHFFTGSYDEFLDAKADCQSNGWC